MAPSCFKDQEALLLNYLQPSVSTLSTVATSTLSTVAMWLPTGLLGTPSNSRILARMWLHVASKSGPVETGQTALVATALQIDNYRQTYSFPTLYYFILNWKRSGHEFLWRTAAKDVFGDVEELWLIPVAYERMVSTLVLSY